MGAGTSTGGNKCGLLEYIQAPSGTVSLDQTLCQTAWL